MTCRQPITFSNENLYIYGDYEEKEGLAVIQYRFSFIESLWIVEMVTTRIHYNINMEKNIKFNAEELKPIYFPHSLFPFIFLLSDPGFDYIGTCRHTVSMMYSENSQTHVLSYIDRYLVIYQYLDDIIRDCGIVFHQCFHLYPVHMYTYI